MSNLLTANRSWFVACSITDVPENGGVCVKYKNTQIAVFNFTRRGEWYATQNLCPHRMQMVLSRGMIGSQNGEPKIACPLHKNTFSLVDGRCLTSSDCGHLTTYPVRIEDGLVYIGMPVEEYATSF